MYVVVIMPVSMTEQDPAANNFTQITICKSGNHSVVYFNSSSQ